MQEASDEITINYAEELDSDGGGGGERYLHASLEDLLSSAALHGICELNRNVLRSAKTR